MAFIGMAPLNIPQKSFHKTIKLTSLHKAGLLATSLQVAKGIARRAPAMALLSRRAHQVAQAESKWKWTF